MRIFIGLSEIANIAATYADGFRALGHETYTAVTTRHRFYPDRDYDVVLDEARAPAARQDRAIRRRLSQLVARPAVLARAARRCDTFVLIFGTSFLPRYWDYPLLKLLGKRIVCVFCGSDVLYGPAYEQEMRARGIAEDLADVFDYYRSLPCHRYSMKLRRVRAAERWADLVLSQPSMGQLQTRPYRRVNLPLDLSRYDFAVHDRRVPKVLHAPSRRNIKGTRYVRAAVDTLRREGVEFEFQCLEGVANDEVRVSLSGADIVIDQLMSQTVATFALEGLATGNAVLARYEPEYTRVPPGCPVVNTTAEALVDRLREVIVDRGLRGRLAHAGRPYVEAHHDHRAIAQQILDWLDRDGIDDHDFEPTFFGEGFTPPSLRERWGELVRCWRWRLSHLVDLASPHRSQPTADVT